MTLQSVEAAERLSRTSFSLHEILIKGDISNSVYTCPHCGSQTEFSYEDLLWHFPRVSCVFSSDVRKLFDLFRERGDAYEESNIDFICGDCEAPVRIFFIGTEVAMGGYSFRLTEVIEKHA